MLGRYPDSHKACRSVVCPAGDRVSPQTGVRTTFRTASAPLAPGAHHAVLWRRPRALPRRNIRKKKRDQAETEGGAAGSRLLHLANTRRAWESFCAAALCSMQQHCDGSFRSSPCLWESSSVPPPANLRKLQLLLAGINCLSAIEQQRFTSAIEKLLNRTHRIPG